MKFFFKPPLNKNRMSLIDRAFDKLDKTKDRKITVEDLRGVYSVRYHPKYISGEWDQDRCLTEFLNKFEVGEHKDGIVTYEEFVQCKLFRD
jgi:Ca2+-binding EF-hand superfamily protein